MGAGQNFANAASNLLLRQGDLQAQRALVGGQSILPTIADSGTRAFATLARIREFDAQQRQRALEQQRKDAAQRAIAQAVKDSTLPDGTIDWNGAVQIVARDFPQEAMAFGATVGEARKKAADATGVELDNRAKRRTAALQMAQAATPETWATIYPQIQQADPDIAKLLTPEFNEEARQNALNAGMSLNDYTNRQRELLKLYTNNKPTEWFWGSLAEIGNEEQWQQFLTREAPAAGITPDIIESAPQHWSEENQKMARGRFSPMTAKDVADLGIRRDTEKRLTDAEERQQTSATATAAREQERLELERRRVKILEDAEARRAKTGTDGDITASQRNVALRWKMDAEAALRKEKNSASLTPMTESEYQSRLKEIDDAYRQMIGQGAALGPTNIRSSSPTIAPDTRLPAAPVPRVAQGDTSNMSVTPPAGRASAKTIGYNIGSTVTLKDGRTVRVKAMDENGRITDYEEVTIKK